MLPYVCRVTRIERRRVRPVTGVKQPLSATPGGPGGNSPSQRSPGIIRSCIGRKLRNIIQHPKPILKLSLTHTLWYLCRYLSRNFLSRPFHLQRNRAVVSLDQTSYVVCPFCENPSPQFIPAFVSNLVSVVVSPGNSRIPDGLVPPVPLEVRRTSAPGPSHFPWKCDALPKSAARFTRDFA